MKQLVKTPKGQEVSGEVSRRWAGGLGGRRESQWSGKFNQDKRDGD